MRKNDFFPQLLRALFFALFFFSLTIPASAKELSYARMKFGLGFFGGAQTSADSNLAGAEPSKIPTYAYEYGVELVIPIDDIFIRPLYAVQNFPAYEGKGSDSTGSYNQSASGQLRMYGGKLSAVIYSNERATRYFYLGFGAGKADLRAQLSRKYTSGSSQSYLQDGTGGAIYWEVHTGVQMMMVQNWALGIEFGYRRYSIQEISSSTKTDLAGATIMGANTLYSTNGAKAVYNVSSIYLNAILELMF